MTDALDFTLRQHCNTSDGFIGHARGCKKSPEDCNRCRQSITYHASLPLATLAVVLADRPTIKT